MKFKVGDRVVALQALFSYPTQAGHSPDVERFSNGIVTDVSTSRTGNKDGFQLGMTFGEKEVSAPSEAIEMEEIYNSPLWQALR